MRNYFVYNGVDSRDYGVYISGQQTFGAPKKAYTFYNIPGRNGALVGYDNRFENLNISYKAFIYKDFEKNLANFRSFLLSVNGYARLEDSYHPDEFRMAAYVGPFEPTVRSQNDAGSFTITFNCKPQRYLLSGETQFAWSPGTLTATGSNLRLYGPNINPTPMTIDLPVTQAGTGTPSPQNPRPITVYDGINIKINGSQAYTWGFTAAQKAPAGTANLSTGEYTKTWAYKRVTSQTFWSWNFADNYRFLDGFMSGVDTSTVISSHMSPYVPQNPSPPFIWYDLSFELEDNGELRIWSDHFYTDEMLNQFLEDNEVIVAAELTSPVAYTGTAYTPVYPDGWIDLTSNGQLTVTYKDAVELVNPSPFPAQPLIRVYGDGEFTLNDVTVTIINGGTYTDIDCEMMDCYEGNWNRNSNVQFSTYNFPVLNPGENTVIGNTIGTLYIVPRWWRL